MVDATVSPGQEPAAAEPYQSLYRRFRPQRFEDVLGQEHVTRALRNAVRESRVAHAYLFSGPRGTGKTSTARILAMALNCEHPEDGEPDGTCPSCIEIRRGASLDVQELDAASNRRLDEMRDLLSRVALGTRGRWKVYIVDEVHQLTPDAASALLKTLEEPPAHVVFVLATTDPQKVLQTIRSRTQHFEFRLLGPEVLGGLLRDINDRAALGVPAEALDLVVRRGRGSARDALSALDQVAALGEATDEGEVVSAIVDALADQDPGRALVAAAEAVGSGREPRRLATDLIEHLRNGFLATQARSLVMLPDDAAADVERQARQMGTAALVRALEVLGQASVDMRDAVDPRVTLEVALVRLAAPQAAGDIAGLTQRVEDLERRVAAMASGQPVVSLPPPPARPAETPSRPGMPPAPSAGAPPAPRSGVQPDAPAAGRGPEGPGSEGAGGRPANRPRPGDGPRPAVAPGRPPVGEPPPLPGRRPAGSRPSLGGLRRGAGAPGRPPADPPPGAAGADQQPVPPPAAGGTGRGVPGSGAPDSGQRGAPSPADAGPLPQRSGGSPRPHAPGGADGARPVDDGRPGAPATPAGTAAAGEAPSREELTKAWGDRVLPGLPPRVKAFLSAGRFVGGGPGPAVFAVPDQGLLTRAQPLRGEVEAALSNHFGRHVPLELALDGAAAPVAGGPSPTPEDDDPSAFDPAELEDAGPAVVSPEQRLLEAFPGAEEVTP